MSDNWIENQSVHHNDMHQHYLNFNLMDLNVKQNNCWKDVWIAIMNSIWNHKNKIILV